MGLPVAIRVPVSFCIPSTLSQADVDAGYVTLGDGRPIIDQPKLQPSKIFTEVFANLTLGALCGQGDGSMGCTTVLKIDEDLQARIIAACAHVKISKHVRPTPKEAVEFADRIGLVPDYGESVFHLILTRLLTFVDRKVSKDTLPNAIQVYKPGKMLWKEHTRRWVPGVTSLQDIRAEESTGFRGDHGPTSLGIKQIVDQATRLEALRGVFDVGLSPSQPIDPHLSEYRSRLPAWKAPPPMETQEPNPQGTRSQKPDSFGAKAPFPASNGNESIFSATDNESSMPDMQASTLPNAPHSEYMRQLKRVTGEMALLDRRTKHLVASLQNATDFILALRNKVEILERGQKVTYKEI